MDVNTNYIQEVIFDAEELKVPGKSIVADYMTWYFNHSFKAR